MKKYKVKIFWGTDPATNDGKPCHYSFKTEAELDAFLLGVDEAAGWLEYEIIED
jgi:hypothetical protein